MFLSILKYGKAIDCEHHLAELSSTTHFMNSWGFKSRNVLFIWSSLVTMLTKWNTYLREKDNKGIIYQNAYLLYHHYDDSSENKMLTTYCYCMIFVPSLLIIYVIIKYWYLWYLYEEQEFDMLYMFVPPGCTWTDKLYNDLAAKSSTFIGGRSSYDFWGAKECLIRSRKGGNIPARIGGSKEIILSLY